MTEFEPRRAFEHLDKLAYEIGPRLAGTPGDRMAADYIREQFSSYGLRTRVHEFKFVNRAARTKATACILAAAFVVTFFLPPEFSLLTWFLALLLWRLLDRIMPKRSSQNIVATLQPKKTERRTAIIAHYDSAPCRVSDKLNYFVKFTFAPALILITMLLVVRVLGIPAWRIVWGVLACIFIPICVGMFVSASSRRISPGANDNASGVAVMLEAARASAESPPADIELTFVASGAEEQGLIGARRLVEDKVLPMDAMVLTLDMLGAGSQAYVVEGNGVFRRTKTSPKLNELLSSCIRGVGIRPKLWWAALAGHDHIPFVRAKIDATTFTIDTKADKDQIGNFVAKAFRLPTAHVRGYRYIHTIEDIPDRIELDNIELAGKVVIEFVKSFTSTGNQRG